MKELPIAKVSVRWKEPVDAETGNQGDNPTKMTPEQFAGLRASIRSEGFLQPTLNDNKNVIIDGAHRYWAAKSEGLKKITCVYKDAKKHKARAIGIGMNRNRGELELSTTSHLMKEIIEGTGWSPAQLSGMTGFSTEEITSMVEDVVAQGEELLEEAASAQEEFEEDPEENKPFVLEIEFKERDVYKRVKRKLKKAGSGDLAQGILAVLGESED